VGFIVYDGYNSGKNTPTNADIAAADQVQLNRTCDADCYTAAGCNYYKAFDTDGYYTTVKSLENNPIPDNPTNTSVRFVVSDPVENAPPRASLSTGASRSSSRGPCTRSTRSTTTASRA
jgi:hypothetical protein